MVWRRRWNERWQRFVDTVSNPHFRLTVLGVLGAVLVWVYLLYLAIQYDTKLDSHTTFCSSTEERDKHILIIVMSIPFFMVGIIGVISEWMTLMENRRAGRKSHFKSLIVFSVVMQIATLVILLALKC
jgi:hypothetical protein